MLAHVDLCSGIGGFALGFQWAGLSRPVLFCDIEEWSRKVLAKHWPDVPISDDVKELASDPRRLVPDCDILTAGYPCQPFSLAGKRRGEKDDRHIWPEIFTIVQAKRPRWCVFENVPGHINMGLDQVLSDLEGEGYAVQPFVVPACAVDAPHRRDRVWIIAAHADSESQSDVTGHGEEGQWVGRPASDDADANSQRPHRAEQHQQRGGKPADRQERELRSVCEVLAGRGDTAERSAADVGHPSGGRQSRDNRWRSGQKSADGRAFVADASCELSHRGRQSGPSGRGQHTDGGQDVADARREGVHESRFSGNAEPKGGQQRRVRPDGLPESANGQRSNVADAKSQRVQGHRPSGTQVAHSHERQGLPLCGDERPATAISQPQSSMGGVADGLSTWLDEPRDIPRVATGVKQRAARLKGLGNAIVPQIAMQIGLTIKAVENG